MLLRKATRCSNPLPWGSLLPTDRDLGVTGSPCSPDKARNQCAQCACKTPSQYPVSARTGQAARSRRVHMVPGPQAPLRHSEPGGGRAHLCCHQPLHITPPGFPAPPGHAEVCRPPGLPTHPRGSPLLTPPDTRATAHSPALHVHRWLSLGWHRMSQLLASITHHPPPRQVFVVAPRGHPTG